MKLNLIIYSLLVYLYKFWNIGKMIYWIEKKNIIETRLTDNVYALQSGKYLLLTYWSQKGNLMFIFFFFFRYALSLLLIHFRVMIHKVIILCHHLCHIFFFFSLSLQNSSLQELSMNDKIMVTQNFIQMLFDLKSHWRQLIWKQGQKVVHKNVSYD